LIHRRTGLFIVGALGVAIGATMSARLRSGRRTVVPAPSFQPRDENIELMRRLVDTVERYQAAAADDRATREIDRNRERRAIWVVIWTLLSLLWLDGVQGDPFGKFVAANWTTLPVAIPAVIVVGGFMYRAFHLRVFRQPLLYGIAAFVMLVAAQHELSVAVWQERLVGIFFGVGSLYYWVRCFGWDDVGVLNPTGADIAAFMRRRNRLVNVGFGLLVVVGAVGAVWYVGAAMTVADRVSFGRQLLPALVVLVLALVVLAAIALITRYGGTTPGPNRRRGRGVGGG
jgi:hypothetical protein